MNCIDAIEGTAKTLLVEFLALSVEYRMDASEYIRNAKAVIDSTIQFINENPEVSERPELTRDVLYQYAKSLWLARLEKNVDSEERTSFAPDLEYQAYSYDYLYRHGNYPR